jgi:PIF1-like helicase/Helix-turn-helix domain/HRDC domain
MFTPDTSNINFQLAADFVTSTNRSVFLTGKAGTGKTTFLKYIRQHITKQMAVLAPTGVAAINAGGATMHSFFQLPFGPYLPAANFSNRGSGNALTDKNALINRLRFNGDKRMLLKQLELLVIDEISMVRSDTLDAIDAILRHFRHRYHEPFGGVQMLFIGDMFQLPPVVPDSEWNILQEYYASPYFFDSHVLQQQPLIHIELDKIYRQSEQDFINVLNQVRNNCLDDEGLALLQTRYKPNFKPDKNENFITLTTHNNKADKINYEELDRLKGKQFSFKAAITGEFGEKAFPAEENLQIKIGAQVMFIKNDIEKVRRYFNGKLGVVKGVEGEEIVVQTNDDTEPVKVKKEIWKNVRYTIDKQKQQIEEDELGTFTQYPLRLAWAITIHKSQGLTFEKAMIDAGAAFAPGQVYVALSRCTSLKGMVLQTPLQKNIITDDRIKRFADFKGDHSSLQPELTASKKNYQLSLLNNLFNFVTAQAAVEALQHVITEHKKHFNQEAFNWVQQLANKLNELQPLAIKFQAVLAQLALTGEAVETNDALQQRIMAGANYFEKQVDEHLINAIKNSPVLTESKTAGFDFYEALIAVYALVTQQHFGICICKNGFEINDYVQKRAAFVLPYLRNNVYAQTSTRQQKTKSAHPLLFEQLKQLRNTICDETGMAIYMVANSKTLSELCNYLPQNETELAGIAGFGTTRIKKFGTRFLKIIVDYSQQHQLQSTIPPKTQKANNKPETQKQTDTKKQSFELFRSGKTIEAIAAERNLAPTTIETHLSYYIYTGELALNELVTAQNQQLINESINKLGDKSFKVLKDALPEEISYGTIRMVIAARQDNKV